MLGVRIGKVTVNGIDAMDMNLIYMVLVVSTLLYIAFLVYNRTIGKWSDPEVQIQKHPDGSEPEAVVRYPVEDLVTEALSNRKFVQDINNVCATDLDHPTSYMNAFEIIDKRIRKIRVSELNKFMEFNKARKEKISLSKVSIENILNCHVYIERLIEFRSRNSEQTQEFQLTGLKKISQILMDQIDLLENDLRNQLKG